MTRLRTPIGPDDHASGPRDAPLQLVEYGDFECPACGAAYPEVERVRGALSGALLFVFRHFPLSQLHPNAERAAEAAEAAGAQGRFWEMHGLLFRRAPALEPAELRACAVAAGLEDLDRFGRELESHEHAARVRRDFMSGVRSGVNGTPTFFVNGYRHDAPFDAEELIEALQGGGAAHP